MTEMHFNLKEPTVCGVNIGAAPAPSGPPELERKKLQPPQPLIGDVLKAEIQLLTQKYQLFLNGSFQLEIIRIQLLCWVSLCRRILSGHLSF